MKVTEQQISKFKSPWNMSKMRMEYSAEFFPILVKKLIKLPQVEAATQWMHAAVFRGILTEAQLKSMCLNSFSTLPYLRTLTSLYFTCSTSAEAGSVGVFIPDVFNQGAISAKGLAPYENIQFFWSTYYDECSPFQGASPILSAPTGANHPYIPNINLIQIFDFISSPREFKTKHFGGRTYEKYVEEGVIDGLDALFSAMLSDVQNNLTLEQQYTALRLRTLRSQLPIDPVYQHARKSLLDLLDKIPGSPEDVLEKLVDKHTDIYIDHLKKYVSGTNTP